MRGRSLLDEVCLRLMGCIQVRLSRVATRLLVRLGLRLPECVETGEAHGVAHSSGCPLGSLWRPALRSETPATASSGGIVLTVDLPITAGIKQGCTS